MISQRAKFTIKLLNLLPKKVKYQMNIKKKRRNLERLLSLMKKPKKTVKRTVSAEGIKAEWVFNNKIEPLTTILYLHGGAYTIGSPKTHRNFAGVLAKKLEAKVLLVDYRLAPEYPFPAALEDSISVYRWMLKDGGCDPNKIIIAGDSAGGGLALSATIKLRNEGERLPKAVICLAPWTDLTLSGTSTRKNEGKDPQLTSKGLKYAADLYLRDENPKNPLASPLFADLSELPPAFIQVGTNDLLLDDSLRVANKIEKAGGIIELDVWKEMTHCFQLYGQFIPESRKAILKIREFIEKYL